MKEYTTPFVGLVGPAVTVIKGEVIQGGNDNKEFADSDLQSNLEEN